MAVPMLRGSLRAVVTSDFMTAHWAELPYDLLGKVSNRIINERTWHKPCVYDISGKAPCGSSGE